MANLKLADQEYHEAMAKAADRAHQALAKAQAKAATRKAAAYAKAKASPPPLAPLMNAQVMRVAVQRPELLAHIPVHARAVTARAMPIAAMPDPPQGYDGMAQRANRNRDIYVDALAVNTEIARTLKRKRDNPELNHYKVAGDLAEVARLQNARVLESLDMFMEANGIPNI